jgi:hypothetical protein
MALLAAYGAGSTGFVGYRPCDTVSRTPIHRFTNRFFYHGLLERVPGLVGVRLYCLPEGSATISTLKTAAARLGWKCYEEERWPTPVIDLATDPERLRAAAGSRRRERYLRNHGRLELRQFDDGDIILGQLGDFFAQHITRFEMAGGESFFTEPGRCEFFEGLTRIASRRGLVRLNRLDWDGRPIAYEYGLSYGKAYFGGPICFAGDLARRSPGKVLFQLLVLGALEAGLTAYDLGTGDDAYKLQFATETPATCTMGLYPRDVLEKQWADEALRLSGASSSTNLTSGGRVSVATDCEG